MPAADPWNPEQYHRFQNERSQPFFDLLALVEPQPGSHIVDLGCGTGELTALLHQRLSARSTLGIDNSAAMLARAAQHTTDSLTFRAGDIALYSAGEPRPDLIFSNAALQWVDDHPALFARLARALAPGGQLAVQMPANHDHLSHTLAAELASESPFASALTGSVRTSPVLDPSEYAVLLHSFGFARQHVRLQVYAHLLRSSADVVEWVRGTLLTWYEKRLPPDLFALFLARYRDRLLVRLPDTRPFFYPFKRIHIWASNPVLRGSM